MKKLLFANSPGWLERVGVIVCELHGDYGAADLQRDLNPFGFEVRQLSDGYEKTFVAVKKERLVNGAAKTSAFSSRTLN